MSEEQEQEEIEYSYTSFHEYITAGIVVLDYCEGIDTQIMSKADEMRIKRMKRKCLRMVEFCVNEMFAELLDTDSED